MKEKGKDINITDSTCSCSAVTAFEHHLSSNTAIPASAPLFAFETADGQWSPMKRAWFMARCNAVWEKEGLVKGMDSALAVPLTFCWYRSMGAHGPGPMELSGISVILAQV